jgi:putative FmdB family regulatory protein
VPTYEYECSKCRRVFEVRQRISDPPLQTCEACGGAVRRLLSAAPFILKGGGWYVTDYPSQARKKALESEKSAGSATEKAGAGEKAGAAEKAGAGDKKTDATPSTATTASAPASSSDSSASGSTASSDSTKSSHSTKSD